MQEREIDKEKSKELAEILKDGETGRPVIRKKVDYTKYAYRRVYNRKILRNIVKRAVGSNKIRNAWHQLRAEGRI